MQRIDIAREVRNARNCDLCRKRKDALSPNAVSGDHDTVTDLPGTIVDVIHRVITDNKQLTRAWFEDTIDYGKDLLRQHYELHQH